MSALYVYKLCGQYCVIGQIDARRSIMHWCQSPMSLFLIWPHSCIDLSTSGIEKQSLPATMCIVQCTQSHFVVYPDLASNLYLHFVF